MESLNDLFPQVANGRIEMGTIGWDGVDEWVTQGTDGTDADGYTMVRVQLYRGKRPTDELKATVGQGSQMLCHIAAGLYRIPKKGERCYVALPAGYENMDGVGVIFAVVSKSPFDQFSKTRVKMDFGDDTDLVIKAKTVTISDYNDDYMAISPVGGFKTATKDGGLVQLKGTKLTSIASSGFFFLVGNNGQPMTAGMVLDPSQAAVFSNGGMLKINSSGNGTWIGGSISVAGGSVMLGAAATVANPALWGVTGIAGIASTSVFISV